jgi:hypothetical protein
VSSLISTASRNKTNTKRITASILPEYSSQRKNTLIELAYLLSMTLSLTNKKSVNKLKFSRIKHSVASPKRMKKKPFKEFSIFLTMMRKKITEDNKENKDSSIEK